MGKGRGGGGEAGWNRVLRKVKYGRRWDLG